MTDFRIRMSYFDPGVVIGVAPFRGEMQKAADWLLQKPASAEHRGKCRREQAKDDQGDAAGRSRVDCGKGLGLGLSGAEKEVARRQSRRDISKNARAPVDPDRLF